MRIEDIFARAHDHRFETGREAGAERRTKMVAVLTVTMRVAEVAIGSMQIWRLW